MAKLFDFAIADFINVYGTAQSMKVCVAHPGMLAGGSEAPAMALLELMQQEHAVTLVTGKPFECDRLNHAYDTRVESQRISVAIAPIPTWLRRARAGDALRGAYLSRYLRQISSGFDLCIGAYNISPFGRPAIQFLADFSWDEDYRQAHDPPPDGLRGLIHRSGPLRRIYLATTRAVVGNNDQRFLAGGDIVVANSRWSADLLARRHGVSAQVIYPPVNASPFAADAPRTGDFVLLGRISPDKRIEEAIQILARVRARGHEFNFHIIGPLDTSPYSARLLLVAQRHSGWVRLRGGMYGAEKFAELARHSYAIHMRAREPFGIAVAEQLKMGLIPFVPADTAPAEIVDDSRLSFDSEDHAVEIIDQVLRNKSERQPILTRLAERAGAFSKDRFAREASKLLRVETSALLEGARIRGK